MLYLLAYAALGTGFPFLMSSLGAATVFFLRDTPRPRFQKATLGFAAGVMTAASVWSLLLPAIEQTKADGIFLPWLPAAAGILIGVVFLAVLDLLLPHLQKQKEENELWRQNALLAAAITLHNIPEGMAVGLAFALSAQYGGTVGALALAFGIGIQNFPEGAAVSLPLRQEGHSRARSFLGGMLSGAVEPVFGMLTVLVAAGVRSLMPWLLSFAAGAMLYVVVAELVPQSQGKSGTCGFTVGFLMMMVLDIALG